MFAVFCNAATDDDDDACPGCKGMDVPISFAKSLTQYDSYQNYIRDTIELDSIDPQDQVFLLANKSSDEYFGYERAANVRPKPAGCEPDVTIVSLRPENATDPTFVYFPTCTRIRRYGGCCPHALLRYVQ